MGSSSSTEAQQQAPPVEHVSSGGVRMTVSSKIVDDARSFKSGKDTQGSESSERSAKSEKSSSNSSNASRGRQSSSNRPKSAPKGDHKSQSSNSMKDGADYEPDKDILALEKKIQKVEIESPSLPTMSTKVVDDVKEILTNAAAEHAAKELSLLEHTVSVSSQYESFPEPKSFKSLISYPDTTVCSESYFAAINCLKGTNHSECASLMDAYVVCSTKYHIDDQTKRVQKAERQL